MDHIYNYKEEKYINRRDWNILDKIDFQNINDEFIENYKQCGFEIFFILNL